jgi:hypothetical protein
LTTRFTMFGLPSTTSHDAGATVSKVQLIAVNRAPLLYFRDFGSAVRHCTMLLFSKETKTRPRVTRISTIILFILTMRHSTLRCVARDNSHGNEVEEEYECMILCSIIQTKKNMMTLGTTNGPPYRTDMSHDRVIV